MKKKELKVCLVCSSGGHLAQMKQIFPIINKKNSFLVTESNKTTQEIKSYIKTYYLCQQERKNIFFLFNFIKNISKSLFILIRERPNVIISTGAGASIPLLILGKVLRAKIIYIESFAKISSPTITGRIVYPIANQFYVQWPNMKKFYPKALYRGKIY